MAAETLAGLHNMSRADLLRDVVVNKLTTAAQEIFATVERTVSGYEEEASGLRLELERLRRQLEPPGQPEIKVEPTDNLLLEGEGGEGGGEGGETLSRFDLDVSEFGIRDIISYAEEEEEGKDEQNESAESTRLQPEDLRDPGPRVPVQTKGAPRKFRVGLLQNAKADSLMDDGLKSPVVKCPRGLQEPDFLALLRSTFPQLTGPFNAFTSDATGSSSLFIRVKAAKKTPKGKKKLRSAPRKGGEERRCSKVPDGSGPPERLGSGAPPSCLRPLPPSTADRTPRKARAKRPAGSQREGGALPAADNREEEEEEEEEQEQEGGGSKPDEKEEKSRESKAKKRRRKLRESGDKKKKRRKKLRRRRLAETERGGDPPVADNRDEKEEEEEEEEEEGSKPDENHKEPRKSRSRGVQTKSPGLCPQTLRLKEDASADRGSPPGGGPPVKRRRRRCSGEAPLRRLGQTLPPADGSAPVQKPRCPRDPKDPDLLDLLRSPAPQGPPYLRVHQCARVAGGTVRLAGGGGGGEAFAGRTASSSPA